MKVHCLFEQSGTFKNEFKKLGYEAFDYDIQNEFGETDFVIDLYSEIDQGYEGKPSIFDNIKKEDLILAFFPCTRFEAQILLSFWGQQYQDKKMSLLDKFERNLRLHSELHRNYELVTRMVIVCLKKGLRLVIENPAGEQHYLTRYWCAKAQLVDKNRRENGDYFKKPTQYWFVNFEPKNNLVFEPISYNAIECKDAIRLMNKEHYQKTGAKTKKEARSMIHPQYANRFIRQYLIEQ